MVTLIYLIEGPDYQTANFQNYPTKTFINKCIEVGYKVICIVEDGNVKNKCWDFEKHLKGIVSLIN
jgi:hypothetical protein